MQLLLLLLITILLTIQLIKSENRKNLSKWFFLDDGLYYIETEPKFTSNDCQMFCENNDMWENVDRASLFPLVQKIINTYGNISTYWIPNNLYYKKHGNCEKLSHIEPFIREEECTTLMGFICKTYIPEGFLRFKNGTEYEINAKDVQHYCDPYEYKYDDIIEFCLIYLEDPYNVYSTTEESYYHSSTFLIDSNSTFK